MPDAARSQNGYLVLADISGYTAFFAGAELEHAQAIIHELTTLIRERLAPPLRFVKLEGDAVFCYADEAAFPDGERLVELLEACYFEYSNRLEHMVRTTTCQCTACASMNTLGLKFIAHFGAYVVQSGGGQDDLAGPDVILAHRLLKNTIAETLGIDAYIFFTTSCLQHLPESFSLPQHGETYDSFSEATGGVHDLSAVLRQMREKRQIYIEPGTADIETVIELPYPPSVVWRYVVDPIERLRWACRLFDSAPDVRTSNAAGRTGTGSSFHCNHGPSVATREHVDWHPFEYVTCRTTVSGKLGMMSPRPAIETIDFTPIYDGGTRIEFRLRVMNRKGISFLWYRASGLLLRAGMGNAISSLRSIIAEDTAAVAALDEPQTRETPLPETKDVIS